MKATPSAGDHLLVLPLASIGSAESSVIFRIEKDGLEVDREVPGNEYPKQIVKFRIEWKFMTPLRRTPCPFRIASCATPTQTTKPAMAPLDWPRVTIARSAIGLFVSSTLAKCAGAGVILSALKLVMFVWSVRTPTGTDSGTPPIATGLARP
jgi:hypothetical protein